MMRPNTRSTDERDKWIGGRIRLARKAIGKSQTALAANVGVTFQQIQKYERGDNRVSVTRMCEIAAALEKPVEFFLPMAEEMRSTGDNLLTPLRNIAANDAAHILNILDRTNARTRKNIVELIASIDTDKA